MSEQMNYMQRVGHSKCVRCDFETSDDMTFEQQDAAMMAHLADKHPDWMGIGRAKPSPETEAAPASEAQAPAALDEERYQREMNRLCGDDFKLQAGFQRAWLLRDSELAALREKLTKYKNIADAVEGYSEYMNAEQERLREQLAQLRARVALLDAQEVELPPLDYRLAAQEQCDERERQLLDAQRAVQAWREVARLYQSEHRKWGCVTSGNEICSACKSYDALAGKGE